MVTQSYELTGHGAYKMTFSGLPVNRDSIVLASASELSLQDGALRPFIGAAFVQAVSVAPQDNGNVDVMVNVGWEYDLQYRVCLVII